jgi:hypothetical protein
MHQNEKCNIGNEVIFFEKSDLKTLKGNLTILVEDNFSKGTSQEIYFLETKDGKRVKLEFCKSSLSKATILKPGQQVYVEGFFKNNIFYVVNIK